MLNVFHRWVTSSQSVYTDECNYKELAVFSITVSVHKKSAIYCHILLLASTASANIQCFVYCLCFIFALVYLYPDLRWRRNYLWTSKVVVWSADCGVSRGSSACFIVDVVVSLATTYCRLWRVNLLAVMWLTLRNNYLRHGPAHVVQCVRHSDAMCSRAWRSQWPRIDSSLGPGASAY